MNNPIKPQVIAGTARGVKLKVAPEARPITGRMKQSLFDFISAQILDSTVVDLYAGSGSIGIESLSRAAKHCTFVENDRHAVTTIRQNLEKTKLTEYATLLDIPVGRFLKHTKTTYDLVFCDPPYEMFDQFELHRFGKLMRDGGMLIIKAPRNYTPPHLQTMPVVTQKQFGRNQLIFVGKTLPM